MLKFFALDNDLNYLYWNKTCEQLFQVKSDEVIGKSWYDMPFNQGFEFIADNYKKVVATQVPQSWLNNFEFEGTMFYYMIYAYPTSNGLVVYVRDHTVEKQLEKDKEESAMQLFHASKLASLGELAASIGHEIKNPLTVIMTNVELIERKSELDLAVVQARLEKIEIAGKRISSIL